MDITYNLAESTESLQAKSKLFEQKLQSIESDYEEIARKAYELHGQLEALRVRGDELLINMSTCRSAITEINTEVKRRK